MGGNSHPYPGYRLRLRLDPIVPFDGWQQAYSMTIKMIFQKVSPERITLETLRFEPGFYNVRNKIFTTGTNLPTTLNGMKPMFDPKMFAGKKRPKVGKYSFSEPVRVDIFGFIIQEIRKYPNCHVALCKESASVWNQLGLDLSKMRCVCQLDYADMTRI